MNSADPTKRILVVDDDSLSLQRAARCLLRAGYRTVLASSGEEAMSLLTADDFDAVISDVVLPGMSGFEVLEDILVRFPGLPVILMTASKQEGIREAALACGARGLLEKPVNEESLIAAVEFGGLDELGAEPARCQQERNFDERANYQPAH